MPSVYLAPTWFFGFSFALEVIFAIVTLSVAYYALKVYKYSAQRECKLFGLGFLSIAVSYIIWAFTTGYVWHTIRDADSVISLLGLSIFVNVGIYLHVLFSVLGLVTLAYMGLNIKSQKAFTLILSLSLVILVFSVNAIVSFYFVSALLLFFVTGYYVKEYSRTRKSGVFLVLLAFIFLFLGALDFTFSAVSHVSYVVGHILWFVGYVFALISFILALRPFRK